MSRKELFKKINELCHSLDEELNINSGGCCYVAAVLAEQLENCNIPYSVYCCDYPCHYFIKVSDRFLNRAGFNYTRRCLVGWDSDNLYSVYENEDWNMSYDVINNEYVMEVIINLFKDYGRI